MLYSESYISHQRCRQRCPCLLLLLYKVVFSLFLYKRCYRVFHIYRSCGQGLAGGYQPLDANDEDLVTYAALALANYVEENSNKTLHACDPDLRGAVRSIQIDAACKQVVAGTNYLIVFHVAFPCRSGPKRLLCTEFETVVFQPLPQTNQPPSVTSINQVG